MSKKEMIKNGEDVSLDDGNVVVINGVSIAEKEAEKPLEQENESQELSKSETNGESAPVEVQQAPDFGVSQSDPVEIPVPTPDVEQETPQIPTAPIDLSGIISSSVDNVAPEPEDPTVYPQINVNPVEAAPISFGNDVSFGEQAPDTPAFGSLQNESFNSFGNSFNGENAFDKNTDNGVFKTEQDVDDSFEKFIADVRKSYQENIAGPTKTLVEFVNRYINWGNQVTANGLNRKLFDEYDELMELLKQQKSYGTQIDNSSFEYNNNSNNTYGDDQFGNGMFR